MKVPLLLTPDELARYRRAVEHNTMMGTQDVARLYHAYVTLLAQFQQEGR